MNSRDINQIRWEEDFDVLAEKQHSKRRTVDLIAKKSFEYFKKCFREIPIYWIKFEISKSYPIVRADGEDGEIKNVIEISVRTSKPSKVEDVIDLALREVKFNNRYERFGDIIPQGDDWYLILLTKNMEK